MDTEPVTQVASGKHKIKSILITASILLIAVIVCVDLGYRYFTVSSYKAMLQEKDNELSTLQSEIETISTRNTELETERCLGTWSKENGCVAETRALLSPVGEEIFCYGDIVRVQWNPEAIPGETVDILLSTPKTVMNLKTVRTTDSEFEWHLPDFPSQQTEIEGGRATIKQSDLYQIRLQSGSGVPNGTSEMFEIKACG